MCRIKDVQEIDQIKSAFNCRWRQWLYFNSDELKEQLEKEFEADCATLLEQKFKKKLSDLSPEVINILPEIVFPNARGFLQSLQKSAELIIKDGGPNKVSY